jgi:hypothetical protein
VIAPRVPDAPVVKWISYRPPEPGVEVRFLSGVLHGSPFVVDPRELELA